MPEKDDLAQMDNLEIEPLSDADLDAVAGGEATSTAATCSCQQCSYATGCNPADKPAGTVGPASPTLD